MAGMGHCREATPSNSSSLAALHSGLEQAHEARAGFLVELSGGLPTTTSRQGENTTTSGYQARQSCAYDRT
jgi:hypothetical protein